VSVHVISCSLQSMDRLRVLAGNVLASPCSAAGAALFNGATPEADKFEIQRQGADVVSVPAFLTFYTGDTRSLEPDGKIFFCTLPNGDRIETERQGMEVAPLKVTVRNARRLPDAFDDRCFALRSWHTALSYDDFFVHEKVQGVIFPESEALLKETLGAAVVLPFDYIVRSVKKYNEGVRMSGDSQQAVKGVATGVHADYTLNGGPRRLEQLATAPKTNDVRERSLSVEELQRARKGRWMIVNLWRNIRAEPLEKTPLAVCDATSVRDEDLVCLEQRFVDRTGENYLAHHASRQQWYYYPKMKIDEVLLLKTWDSKEGLSVSDRFTFHAAFQDPSSSADAPERESMEVRCLCIFDN
jgi:hypothetical protein